MGIALYVRNGMVKKYYAHSLEGKPPSEWQPLEEHLKMLQKWLNCLPMLLVPAVGVIWRGFSMI